MPEPLVATPPVATPAVIPPQQPGSGVKPVAPAATPPPVAPTPTPATPSADVKATDVIKRIGQAAPSPQKPSEIPPELRLNKEELLKDITDPKQREFFERKFADAERGINEKFMKVADLRRQTESQVNQPWTPDRIQTLLRDPSFVAAANTHLQSRPPSRSGNTPGTWEGTEDQWTALSEEEQRTFLALDRKATEANQKVDQLLASQGAMQHQQEHERLRTKYADYDSQTVDTFMQAVIDNRVTGEQLKEAIYKSQMFDAYVERAYQLGLKDRNGNLQEKVDGSTGTTNLNVSSTDAADKPQIQQGERASRFFVRLADWNLRHRK